MLLLSLLTGTPSTGVSVSKDGETLIEISIEGGIRQSETIFKMIEDSFTYIDNSLEEIDAIAILIGPGSFTGLRVGFACAKAMSYALNKPIIPVSTMDAISNNVSIEGEYLVLMDARKERCYAKLIRDKNKVNDNTEYILDLNELEKNENKTYVFGEGILKYKEKLEEKNYVMPQEKDVFLTVGGLQKAALLVDKESYISSFDGDLNYLKSKDQVVCKKEKKKK